MIHKLNQVHSAVSLRLSVLCDGLEPSYGRRENPSRQKWQEWQNLPPPSLMSGGVMTPVLFGSGQGAMASQSVWAEAGGG